MTARALQPITEDGVEVKLSRASKSDSCCGIEVAKSLDCPKKKACLVSFARKVWHARERELPTTIEHTKHKRMSGLNYTVRQKGETRLWS